MPAPIRRALPRPVRWLAGLLAVAGLLAGCASLRSRLPAAGEPSGSPVPQPAAGDPRVRVVAIARSLLGASYRFGGEGRGGFDCSSFTSYVFAQVGRWLPRTAQEQAAAGFWVALDELGPGDLVFFGPARDRLEHVGLIVSPPGEPPMMIHAAKSRGVIESDVLASSYWLGRLQLGRRLLEDGASTAGTGQ